MRVLRHLSWAGPLAVGALLLCLDIAEPWTGSYDANGALFSTAARNTLRYGLVATRGGQVVNAGELTPDRFRFYAHHPPGISLTMAASFAIFGDHEWSARLVPIAFTLGAAALLYVVAAQLAGVRAGFFATLVFVLQPMVAFYGRMPDHEAPAAFFALLLAALYLGWQRDGRKAWLAAMCVAAFAGLWYGWVVFVMPLLLLGYHALVKGRGWQWMLLPVAAGALGFAGVLGHVAFIEGGLGGLWQALVHRVGSRAGDRGAAATFGFVGFITRQAGYFGLGYSLLAALLCLPWLGLASRSRREGLLVAALAAFAAFNVAAFRQGAYVHIYYQFFLAIPLSLMAGGVLAFLVPWAARRWHVAVVVVALVAGIGAEGWWKLDTIRRAQFDEEQVSIGRRLRMASRPADRVLLLWARRSSFRQLTYYADRDVTVVPDRAAVGRAQATGRVDVYAEADREGETLTVRRPPSAPPRPPGR